MEGTKSVPDIGNFEMALLKEQGFICAYCNNRIPEYKKERRIKYCKVKVEHWHPQTSTISDAENLDTNYDNMIICCTGGQIFSENPACCDTRKKELFITLNPQIENHINQLKYTSNGQIYCIDYDNEEEIKQRYQNLLNTKGEEVTYRNGNSTKYLKADDLEEEELKLAIQYDILFTLNLNTRRLTKLREDKWNHIHEEIVPRFRTPHMYSVDKRALLSERIHYFQNVKDKDGKFEPFCMVKIFYLQERLKKLTGA